MCGLVSGVCEGDRAGGRGAGPRAWVASGRPTAGLLSFLVFPLRTWEFRNNTDLVFDALCVFPLGGLYLRRERAETRSAGGQSLSGRDPKVPSPLDIGRVLSGVGRDVSLAVGALGCLPFRGRDRGGPPGLALPSDLESSAQAHL